MKVYFLKRTGKNWWGNFYHIKMSNTFHSFLSSFMFFRKKDAELYRKSLGGEYGKQFVVWSAEVKIDSTDNRNR